MNRRRFMLILALWGVAGILGLVGVVGLPVSGVWALIFVAVPFVWMAALEYDYRRRLHRALGKPEGAG
jgi:hypothetical protein